MSKERLEEIREIDQEISNGFALEDLDLNTMTVVNRDHFEWLIEQAERVQKLEEEVDRYHISLWQELVLNHVLTEQNKRYREALEFINEELELVLHSNKGLAEKMFYIENSKRKITEALEGEE